MKAIETKPNGPIALKFWLRQIGVDPVTAWRWRNEGWLEVINICGRLYVEPAAIDEFTRRAKAGEFARVHKVPPPPNAARLAQQPRIASPQTHLKGYPVSPERP